MNLKQRLAAGKQILGCFVKTPHQAVVELLGLSALDCLVLDAEHAPFDRTQQRILLRFGETVYFIDEKNRQYFALFF